MAVAMATRGRRRERCPASSMKRTVRRRVLRSADGVMGLGWWRTDGRWFSSKVEGSMGTSGMVFGGGGGGAAAMVFTSLDMMDKEILSPSSCIRNTYEC